MSKRVTEQLRIRPLGDRLLVRRDRAESETPGGIILPDSVQAANKTRKGTVVAVGLGKKLEEFVTMPPTIPGGNGYDVVKRLPMDVSIGDRVYFQQWAGNDVTNGRAKDEEDLIMLREEDVMGIIEQE